MGLREEGLLLPRKRGGQNPGRRRRAAPRWAQGSDPRAGPEGRGQREQPPPVPPSFAQEADPKETVLRTGCTQHSTAAHPEGPLPAEQRLQRRGQDARRPQGGPGTEVSHLCTLEAKEPLTVQGWLVKRHQRRRAKLQNCAGGGGGCLL